VHKKPLLPEGPNGLRCPDDCCEASYLRVLELAEKVRTLLGKSDLPITFDQRTPSDIKVFDVDNSKVRSLGFEFQTAFEEGLEATLQSLKGSLKL
jgi:nucleoside-diphosphate-sugar epimerase